VSSGVGGDGKLDVWYANKASGWSAPKRVDDVTLNGNFRTLHPTIAFTGANDLVVTWLAGTFNYVPDGSIHVRTRSSTGAWAASQMINDPNGAMTTIDNGPSLLITPDGTIHLTFVAANPPDQVRYWYNTGTGWRGDRQPPAQITHDPSLGPDSNGGIIIYGHGTPLPDFMGHGDNLYSFHKTATGSWEPWTLFTTGAFDSSVSTRWAQFFQAFSQTVDVAYWADASPNVLYIGTDVFSPSGIPAAAPQPRLTSVTPGAQVSPPVRRSPTVGTQVSPYPVPLRR
jgi:hypothetical protein